MSVIEEIHDATEGFSEEELRSFESACQAGSGVARALVAVAQDDPERMAAVAALALEYVIAHQGVEGELVERYRSLVRSLRGSGIGMRVAKA